MPRVTRQTAKKADPAFILGEIEGNPQKTRAAPSKRTRNTRNACDILNKENEIEQVPKKEPIQKRSGRSKGRATKVEGIERTLEEGIPIVDRQIAKPTSEGDLVENTLETIHNTNGPAIQGAENPPAMLEENNGLSDVDGDEAELQKLAEEMGANEVPQIDRPVGQELELASFVPATLEAVATAEAEVFHPSILAQSMPTLSKTPKFDPAVHDAEPEAAIADENFEFRCSPKKFPGSPGSVLQEPQALSIQASQPRGHAKPTNASRGMAAKVPASKTILDTTTRAQIRAGTRLVSESSSQDNKSPGSDQNDVLKRGLRYSHSSTLQATLSKKPLVVPGPNALCNSHVREESPPRVVRLRRQGEEGTRKHAPVHKARPIRANLSDSRQNTKRVTNATECIAFTGIKAQKTQFAQESNAVAAKKLSITKRTQTAPVKSKKPVTVAMTPRIASRSVSGSKEGPKTAKVINAKERAATMLGARKEAAERGREAVRMWAERQKLKTSKGIPTGMAAKPEDITQRL